MATNCQSLAEKLRSTSIPFTTKPLAKYMITAFYASLLNFLIAWLSLNVIKARRKHKIRYGDGDIIHLVVARTAHSNTVQYVPLALILLLIMAGYIFRQKVCTHCTLE